MLKTITIGRHLSVQGVFVRMVRGGMCQVRVGSRTYTGRPV